MADGIAVLGPTLVDSCKEQRNPSEAVSWPESWPRTGCTTKPPAAEPEGTTAEGVGEEEAQENKPRFTWRQCSKMLSAQELVITNFSEIQFPHL